MAEWPGRRKPEMDADIGRALKLGKSKNQEDKSIGVLVVDGFFIGVHLRFPFLWLRLCRAVLVDIGNRTFLRLSECQFCLDKVLRPT